MPQLNNRSVSAASVHTLIHFPTIGQLGPSLVVSAGDGPKTIQRMTISDGTLVLQMKSIEVAIPLANVTSMLLVPEGK